MAVSKIYSAQATFLSAQIIDIEVDLSRGLHSFSIVLGYLLASEDIEADVEKKLFIGELSLDGNLRGVKGALPITQKAKQEGFREIFLPQENAEEASSISGIT